MHEMLKDLLPYKSDPINRIKSRNEVEEGIQELAYLIQEYQFSEREFKVAGVDPAVLKKWLRGLALLTEG